MDDPQADLFGASPKPKASKSRPTHSRPATAPNPVPVPVTEGPPPAVPEPPADPVSAAARLSPAELDALAAALPDDALARLLLAAVRQLRRRLARGAGRAGRRPSPALDRAARQVAAELGTGDDAA